MSDIKNALAEKRKKLDELKKKREARKAATPVTPVKPTTPTSLRSPTGASSADELLASVNVLVNTPSAGDTLSEAVGSAPIQHSTSGGFKVKLKSVNDLAKQILPEITILPVETPKYTRETQTDFDQNSYSKWQQEEQDEKQRRMEAAVAKKKAEEQKQKELEDKIKKDTEDDEKKRRELNQQQKKQILESKEFLDFFSRSSKFVERALTQNDRFDITIDYKIAGKKDDDKKASSILSSCETFFDKNRVYDRPVTSIDWSPSFKELICCSYAQKEDVMSLDPDGLVLVWNMHMNERPEYSFYCQSAVLTAQWHPGNPKMIIGGTYSGQIVLWDTREKNTPVARTSLSQGHTHPLFSLSAIPSVNLLHNIISVSTDGRLCIWNDNDLLEPHTTLDLSWQDKEVVTTCLGFAGRDTNTVVLGSDEGNLYRARLYDKPGVFDAIQAHHAPITQVQFHPSYKNSPRDIKDLFLTSSYDWTVKLWSAKTSRCLYTFESAKDYVYDVQWSPIHPSLFVSGDGTGFVDFWDLNKDTEVPIHHVNVLEQPGVDKKLQKDRAVSRLKWSDDGKKLALGSSEGQLKVYEVSSEISKATDEDASNFYEKMKSATIE